MHNFTKIALKINKTFNFLLLHDLQVTPKLDIYYFFKIFEKVENERRLLHARHNFSSPREQKCRCLANANASPTPSWSLRSFCGTKSAPRAWPRGCQP